MSVRWMAVQYVGNTLRLPVVNDGDMDKPFGSSILERDVKRIVVNPFSDSPQTFVPESDNAKLRELFLSYWKRVHSHVAPNVERDYLSEMRELGIEVD